MPEMLRRVLVSKVRRHGFKYPEDILQAILGALQDVEDRGQRRPEDADSVVGAISRQRLWCATRPEISVIEGDVVMELPFVGWADAAGRQRSVHAEAVTDVPRN